MPIQRSVAESEEMAPEAERDTSRARRGSLLPLTLIAAGLWVLIIAGIVVVLT